MADETTSASASTAPPAQDARPVQPTSNEAPPASPTPKPTAPSAPTTGQQPELSAEERRVRQLQSQYTQQLRQRDAALAATQQQLNALRQQMVNVQAQGMDETEAEIFRRDQYIRDLQAEIAQRDQYAAQVQHDMRTNQALFKIASETGLPFEEVQQKFWETGDADTVWTYAHRESLHKLTKAQIAAGEKAAQQLAAVQEKQEEDAAIANEKPVDLGSGGGTARAKAPVTAEDYVKRYMGNPNRIGKR